MAADGQPAHNSTIAVIAINLGQKRCWDMTVTSPNRYCSQSRKSWAETGDRSDATIPKGECQPARPQVCPVKKRALIGPVHPKSKPGGAILFPPAPIEVSRRRPKVLAQ